ncbi:MAG: cyclic nucleotide-binding domain-containing protein [Rhodospirillales bacterium]|nr:cyclic nucleotide-binding domain-containing protein [Rhodospirillales bacterium]MCC7167245.1 cyclic nucleotide-binding domain-containing protein [Rhodospirillales bacterium]
MVTKFIERKVYYPGQKVFSEGEDGNRAYVVERGLIEISKNLPDGSEKILGTIGAGGIFGEMALIDNQPRMATARAVQESTCIFISRQTFEDKLRRTDPFIKGLLSIFVRNIRNLTQDKLKK